MLTVLETAKIYWTKGKSYWIWVLRRQTLLDLVSQILLDVGISKTTVTVTGLKAKVTGFGDFEGKSYWT